MWCIVAVSGAMIFASLSSALRTNISSARTMKNSDLPHAGHASSAAGDRVAKGTITSWSCNIRPRKWRRQGCHDLRDRRLVKHDDHAGLHRRRYRVCKRSDGPQFHPCHGRHIRSFDPRCGRLVCGSSRPEIDKENLTEAATVRNPCATERGGGNPGTSVYY
jgi:hypothetical protein